MSNASAYCLMTVLFLPSIVAADQFTTTYKEAPPIERASWKADHTSIYAKVYCYENSIFSFFPIASCRVVVSKSAVSRGPLDIVYFDTDYGEIKFQGEVKNFDTRYVGNETTAMFQYNDGSGSFDEEAMYKIGPGTYTLNGLNDYVKEEVADKKPVVQDKLLMKQALITAAAIVLLFLAFYVFKVLCKCIRRAISALPGLSDRAKDSVSKFGDVINKVDAARRNKKLRDTVVNETVLLSVRDAYNRLDSDETAELRKEISKAIANNDAQLANKLGEVLANVESRKD